jgi:hypothetical protein
MEVLSRRRVTTILIFGGFVFLVGIVINSSSLGPYSLLCSDGRCGQSSKLSREGAERDLDLWADKEELKNKLDELQTVMDRGMTHKSASQQLNQYFDQLDHEAQQQRRHAEAQAQAEGLTDLKDQSPTSTLRQKPKSSITEVSTHSSEQSENKGSSKLSASLSSLSNIVKSVAQPPKSEEIAHSHASKLRTSTSKLSAAAALADLDAYFDSLPTSRKAGKVRCHITTVPSISS